MVRLLIFLGALLAFSAAAPIVGEYENYSQESTTTVESSAYGSGSGDDVVVDDGFSSGADSVAIETDCFNKEDGLYTIGGCSPQFLTCSGGIARVMDCPADLVYDHRIVACEYPTNVPECSGSAPQDIASTTEQPEEYTTVAEETTTITEETTTTEYVQAELSTTPYAVKAVTRAAAERNCIGQEDGFYSYGVCSDHYTACSNGYTIPMQCPANLAFDEARVICDYPIAVPECQSGSGSGEEEGSAEVLPAADFSGELPYDNGYGYEETTTAAETTTESYESEETTTNPYESEESTTESYEPEETTTESYELEETTTNPYIEEEKVTTVAEDVPSTDGYETYTVAAAYAAPYGFESTTAADVPSTTTTTAPYVEETTTVVYVEVPEVSETVAADEPSTTEVYAPVEETTTYPYVEVTTEADEPSTSESYGVPAADEPEVLETTAAPYVPQTTDVSSKTEVVYVPEITETTAAEQPSTTEVYAPVEETSTAALYAEETTIAEDVPVTEPEVTTTSSAYVPDENTAVYTLGTTTEVEAITAAEEPVPECTEGVFVIEPCSQHYKKCVNGKEAVFTCESGLFFSEQQAGCTPAHIIPECQIKIAQPY